jgi:hypothetical protein
MEITTDEGVTLICRSSPSPATPGTDWWWIEVAGENQRYAAFRVEPGDTPAKLKPRILTYYAQLLADRARPREFKPRWSRPQPAAKPGEVEGGTPGQA